MTAPLSHTYFHPTDLHGTTLRLPSHRAVQWLTNPDHERGRWRALRLHVTETDVIFDIGAEQGDLSALLASWVPGGGVVLVEPNVKAWPCIRATFEENRLGPRVLGWWQGLVGAEVAQPAIPVPADLQRWPDMGDVIDPAAGFVNMAEERAEHQVTTLDVLAAAVGSRPSVLNIDVEGAELEVLRGAERMLSEDRPVIALSVHPAFLAHWWGAVAADVLDVLDRHRYRCDLVHADHELHYVAVPL